MQPLPQNSFRTFSYHLKAKFWETSCVSTRSDPVHIPHAKIFGTAKAKQTNIQTKLLELSADYLAPTYFLSSNSGTLILETLVYLLSMFLLIHIVACITIYLY